MLEKARERNLYDRLEQLDLLTMMQGEAAASYDVVFAADVFVYLGKLDELVEQAQKAAAARTGSLPSRSSLSTRWPTTLLRSRTDETTS